MQPILARSTFLIFLLAGLQFLSACGDPKPVRRTQYLMGTLVEITILYTGEDESEQALSAAFDEVRRIEELTSVYIPTSELSQLNRKAGGEFIKVSPEVKLLLEDGIHWAKVSDGAFDISIGPLVKLWDLDSGGKKIPPPEFLQRAVKLVGYKDIQFEGDKVRLARAGMALDMGGIAKGYAVDRAIAVLKEKGMKNAIVNAGGDLLAIGKRSPEKPWIIGLQHPRRPEWVVASFAATGQGIATSGDYQKYFVRDGHRFHHILNPKDGMPAQDVMSVTIITSSVMKADALSTAAFVLGPEKGLQLVESLEGAEGMFALVDGSIKLTSGFKNQPEFSLKH